MTKIYRIKYFLHLFVLLLVVLAGESISNAQCSDAGIRDAVADTSDNSISLVLFPRITDKDKAVAGNPDLWSLVDISPGTGAVVKINSVTLEADSLHPNNFLSATLHYVGTLDSKRHYVLSIVGLTFNGCVPPQPPFTRVLFDELTPAVPSAFGSSKAQGREDSDLYIAGQLEGSRHTRAKQTADVKVEIPFSRNLLGRQRDVAPYFSLKASNSKKSDADSMKFGVLVRTSSKFEHLGIRNVNWETDGRIEADRRFGNVNATWANTLFFLPRTLGEAGNKKVLAFIQPSIGLELGRNLKSPVKAAENRGIARLTGGASLYLFLNTGSKFLDSISFQTDYIRRWPLHGEVAFDEDDDGNLFPLTIGRSPRDYVTTKIEYSVNDFFGLAVGYDYGKLPPNFKLVDSHFTFGFVYKKRLIPRIK